VKESKKEVVVLWKGVATVGHRIGEEVKIYIRRGEKGETAL